MSPKRRPYLGLTLEILSIALGLSVALLLVGFGFYLLTTGALLGPFAGIVVAVSAWHYLFRPIRDWGRRFSAPLTAEVLASDPRPTILYLRSFGSESRVTDEERYLASMLEASGPFVAIGRPGEAAPRLGAKRLYVSEAEWKGAVTKLLNRSSLVIMLAGRTPGLGWEVEECKQLLEPRQLMVLIPSALSEYAAFAQLFADRLSIELPVVSDNSQSFLQRFRDYFPRSAGLSPIHSTGHLQGLIAFDTAWRPLLFSFNEGDYRPADVGIHEAMETQLRKALVTTGNYALAAGLRSPDLPVYEASAPGLMQVGFAVRAVTSILFVIGWVIWYFLG